MAPNKEVSVIVRAKNATAEGLSAAKSSIASFAGGIRGLLAPALALFSGVSIASFLGLAKEEATGAERAVTQLGNTLANFGVDIGKVRPEIDAAIASLQQTANIDDDDAIAVLDKLVGLTGNYSGSLRNLQLVADVAARKNIDLGAAADIVGRAMAGQTRVLREFGINAKDAADGVEQLRDRVGGAATTEMRTLDGQLQRIRLGFNDVAQEVGSAVAESPAFRELLDQIVDGLRRGAEWLKTNREETGLWVARFIIGTKAVGVTLWSAVRIILNSGQVVAFGMGKVYGEFVAWLLRMLNLIPETVNRAIELVNRIPGVEIEFRLPDFSPVLNELALRTEEAQGRIADAAHAVGYSLVDIRDAWVGIEDRAQRASKAMVSAAGASARALGNARASLDEDAEKGKAAGGKNALRKAIEDREEREREERALVERRVLGPTIIPGGFDERALDAQNAAMAAEIAKGVQVGPLDLDESWRTRAGRIFQEAGATDAEDQLKTLGDSIDELVEGPLLSFADASAAAFEAMISGSKNAGQAFKAAVGAAIKAAAQSEGLFWGKKAIAALGEGLLTGKPNAFAAAAKYALASTGFLALAGAGGAMSMGGAGGSGGGSTEPGGSLRPAVGAGAINVTLKGSRYVLDPRNSDDLDAFKSVLETLAAGREINLQVED